MYTHARYPARNTESWVSGCKRHLSEDITQAFSPIRLRIITNTAGKRTAVRHRISSVPTEIYGPCFLLRHASYISTEALPLIIRALQNHVDDRASLHYLKFITNSGSWELLRFRRGVFEIRSSSDISRYSRPKLNVSPLRPQRLYVYILKPSSIHCNTKHQHSSSTHITCGASVQQKPWPRFYSGKDTFHSFHSNLQCTNKQ